MFRRPSLRALALAAVATLVVAAPATASAPALTIKHINLSNWPNVAVTVQTPDPGATPQLAVTENGQTASNVRQSVGPQSAVAVVIDTSHSMQRSEADRRDHGRDHVRHRRPVERHARRVRLRREALHLGRAPGHLGGCRRRSGRTGSRLQLRHRDLRRHQHGVTGPRRTARRAAGDRPRHRRLVRERLGHLRPGGCRGQVGPRGHLCGQHREHRRRQERAARTRPADRRAVPVGDRRAGARCRLQPDLGRARKHVHVHVPQPGAEGHSDQAGGQRARPCDGALDRDGPRHDRGRAPARARRS